MATAAETAILAALAATPSARSVAPADIARTLVGDDPRWQRLLPEVRRAAVALSSRGVTTILRHGRGANPANFKGIYRIGRGPSFAPPGDASPA